MSDKKVVRAGITAVAHFVPDEVVPNSFFESYLDTTDEWIQSRAGIKERRILRNGATSDLAVPAIKKLLEQRGISATDIDMILVGTVTPDMLFPSTACVIQEKIGATNAWGFDLSAACSGFLFTLETGRRFIESGAAKKILIVGADKMSSITNYQDRNTCILFGDGAGVVLLEPVDEALGIRDSILRIDGTGGEYLHMKGGGSLNPPSHETIDKQMHYVYQDGKAVFKRAVIGMADVSAEIVERNNLTKNDIAFLVPHQANLRIIEAARERVGLTHDQVMINIDRYGNTTSGTIPICLSEWSAAGKIKKGDYLVLASFGAGFTWGSILLRWAF